jgi:hypothetical protein
MEWQFNDGGRAAAGRKGFAGDCVVRAIAIATNAANPTYLQADAAPILYRSVYADLFDEIRTFSKGRSAHAKRRKAKGASPRHGVPMPVIKKYLARKGWTWVPTMQIGSGCKVHLHDGELPPGHLIVRVSKHVTAVIDGVIYDTYDCSRDGTRCIYGYWIKT